MKAAAISAEEHAANVITRLRTETTEEEGQEAPTDKAEDTTADKKSQPKRPFPGNDDEGGPSGCGDKSSKVKKPKI